VKAVALLSRVFVEMGDLSYKAIEAGEKVDGGENEEIGGEPNRQRSKPNNPRIQSPLAKHFSICDHSNSILAWQKDRHGSRLNFANHNVCARRGEVGRDEGGGARM
jgi:hypothetical protein